MMSSQKRAQGLDISIGHPDARLRPLAGNTGRRNSRARTARHTPVRTPSGRPQVHVGGHRRAAPLAYDAGGAVKQPIGVPAVSALAHVSLASCWPHMIRSSARPPFAAVGEVHAVWNRAARERECNAVDEPHPALCPHLAVADNIEATGPEKTWGVRVCWLPGAPGLRKWVGRHEQGSMLRQARRHSVAHQEMGQGFDGPRIVVHSLPLASIEMVGQRPLGASTLGGLAILSDVGAAVISGHRFTDSQADL